ncbi:MAG TPA: type II toxin-antitoxin system PemK/MazF family toxin [Gemmataceae bacterium]|jgi:mRNA interferase MazF|nr:type II toxin-antitoxin system PemK/MazF family toxin [Gemmataceae bacterium]
MASPDRGSVWLVDLGMAAKVRPCLVLSVPTDPQDRVLVTLVPHTTSVQGTRFEVAVKARFLRSAGVFDAQQIITVPQAKLIRKLGDLPTLDLTRVEDAVRRWLGL